jgi:hypothetical protein
MTSTRSTAAASADAMTEEESRGKNLLTTLLLMSILFDVTVSLLAVTVSGAAVLPRMVRFGLILLLCAEMYRGSIAARRVTIALCLLGGLWLLVTMVAPQNPRVTMIGISCVVFLVGFPITLISARSIDAFMAFQRRKALASIRKLEVPEAPTAASDQDQ